MVRIVVLQPLVDAIRLGLTSLRELRERLDAEVFEELLFHLYLDVCCEVEEAVCPPYEVWKESLLRDEGG